MLEIDCKVVAAERRLFWRGLFQNIVKFTFLGVKFSKVLFLRCTYNEARVHCSVKTTKQKHLAKFAKVGNYWNYFNTM